MSGRDIGASVRQRVLKLDSEWGLEKIVEQVRYFASAPLAAVAEEDSFDLKWRPGGPWE